MKNMDDDDILLTVNQASIVLKVHPLTIRRYIRDGKLKAVKMAGNIRISKGNLDSIGETIYPTTYTAKKTEKSIKSDPFNLDDPIFRLKGRGLSIYKSI